MRDPYEVLRVPRSATADDIKQSFRRLAKVLHPDGNKNDPHAPARFAELSSAHEILGDADKRRAFDRGEIDSEGKPVRQPVAHATQRRHFTSGLGHIVTCLVIAVLIPVATLPLIIRGLTPLLAVMDNPANKIMPTRASTAIHHAANSQLDHEQIELLIGRAQKLVSEGDVGAARVLLQRAEVGDARAALALNATYDPIMLAILQGHSVAADDSPPYNKVREFGSQTEQQRSNLLTAVPVDGRGAGVADRAEVPRNPETAAKQTATTVASVKRHHVRPHTHVRRLRYGPYEVYVRPYEVYVGVASPPAFIR